MAVKWKWKAAAGGAVSPELQNKVNQNETKINTIEQKYVKKDEANTFTAANTFNAGSNLLTYTSTNTTKPDNEVLTRKDLTYVRKVRTNFNIPSNGYQTAEFTIDGLQQGLNEFFVVCCKEYGYDFSGQRVIGDYVVTNQNVEDKYIAACCEYVQLKKPELIDLIFTKNSQYKNERSKYGNH